jgi:PPK2 family polyphosphate:nucleotide phosphotransferase
MTTVAKGLARIAESYRVRPGKKFRLAGCDPNDNGGLDISKKKANALLAEGVEKLADLQSRLYAQDRWSLLVVIQAMDAAGKDSTIKHVMSGINPQGCQVVAFKTPSSLELDHDFLWRCARELPERGRIGIFNRSHYEEVLVVRVHANILASQHLPPGLVRKDIWKERYESINDFERHLARNGTRVLKFFLNVSKEEQRKRFLERLDLPEKNWKFAMGDVSERGLWKDYMQAYEDAISATSTGWAPWYVVPADRKWFTRLVVSQVIVDALEDLGLEYPKVDAERKKELAEARKALEKEKG